MILFNQLFKKYLVNKHNFYEIMLIRAFEVSQFIRMIPFKVAINEKAILFYGLACKLIKDLKMITKKKLNSKTFPLAVEITNTKKIDYSIVITKNLFNKNNNLLENKQTILNNSRRLIFIDSNVNAYYQKK